MLEIISLDGPTVTPRPPHLMCIATLMGIFISR